MPWTTDDTPEAKDPGIEISHPSFAKGESITFYTIVTDEKVKAANRLSLANKEKEPDQTEYQVQLIHAMIKEAHVINARTKKPLGWTPAAIRKLSVQQRQWLVMMINTECTGMRPAEVSVDIKGEESDFRESTPEVQPRNVA